MRLVRYQLLYPAIYFVAHGGNAPPFPMYTYGVLSFRPMCQFCGDVRVRTGVCTNVYTILLSDCIGFEVLGTSTNYHEESRLHIRRPIDTGQNFSVKPKTSFRVYKRLGSKCVTVWRGSNEAAWNCTNLVSQLLEKILSVYCLIHLRDRIIPTTKYHQL